MAFLLAVMPWLIGLSMAAVVGVLFSGILTMGRTGADSQRRANRLMRWRVGTQLFTVLLVAFYFLLLNAH
jgi:hypothetical protein